ncbi:MAG: hypothetical protein ACE5H9_18785 [Anaerolineae bacterium]
MSMLRVLVCGSNSLSLQQIANKLQQAGLEVRTSTQPTDYLCQPESKWDMLFVDLDGVSSFLRGLLPAVRRRFPHLSMVGWADQVGSEIEPLALDMGLDGYLPKSILSEGLLSPGQK